MEKSINFKQVVSLLLIIALAGCGGKKVKKRPVRDNEEVAFMDMPVGLQDDKNPMLVFDDDIEGFILDEEDSSNLFKSNDTIAMNEQDKSLDFEWDKFEPDEKLVVYYSYDGRVPRSDQTANLKHADKLAKKIYDNGQKIVLQGHACKWRGTAAYNLAISQDRAEQMKKHLVAEQSIPASAIKTYGMGNEQPIAFEFTKEGQAPNRRVEIYALT